ncbi:DUF418 domain-containing protein [Actinomadura sp. HBU206391]|uniref:DUF418 domain-containing protein n=1 Tax=Actinomadura sp. HBU206391 TaxID=2731692 RepID=UPI00164F2CED|nr:DUF418 domain-containing protein [Actinomadura sp. HBU206391]MBC6460032.1 DUF418 domain-containing protein [Actinomadura sp. HBU206391]
MTAPEDGRVREIDALRGLALCGILFVNIVGITGMPTGPDAGAAPSLRHHAYETLLHQRFFPIFCMLFGLGFALFLGAAARRTRHPRLALLARLGFLIPIGLVHQALQPREVLLVYAVAGIVVLLPASFLPRAATLIAGLAATAAALFAGGGAWLIPGLFLLGMAAAQYGLHRGLDRHGRWEAPVFGVTAVLAVALNTWQIRSGTEPSGSPLAATAGVVTAIAYTSGLLALLRTTARRPLGAVLEPLGRMALTNYVVATPAVIAADQVLRLGEAPRYGTVMALGVAILIASAAVSMAWLRRFRHGPVEWVWRCLTWWSLIPNRTPSTRPAPVRG